MTRGAEGTMRPKKHKTTGSNDLFWARLDQIINMKQRDRAALQPRPAGMGSRPLHDRSVVAQPHLRAVQ